MLKQSKNLKMNSQKKLQTFSKTIGGEIATTLLIFFVKKS